MIFFNAWTQGYKILFVPFLVVTAFLVLGLIFNIIRQRNFKGLIYKNKDISSSKINSLATILSKYDGIYKIVINKNVLTFINEYNIYVGLVINEIGTVIGNENEESFYLRAGADEKTIENEIPYLNYIVNNIENMVNTKVENKFILSGDSCPFLVETQIEKLNFKDVLYRFTKKELNSRYTEEQINAIANNLEKLNVK